MPLTHRGYVHLDSIGFNWERISLIKNYFVISWHKVVNIVVYTFKKKYPYVYILPSELSEYYT